MLNYANVSDKDLLRLVIMEKSNEEIVEPLLNEFNTLPNLVTNSTKEQLLKIKGMGVARINQLQAIQELAYRLYSKNWRDKKYKITSPTDVTDLLMFEMKFLDKEHFKLILLDTKHQIVDIVTVSIGSLNASIVHPREVFKPAIIRSASSVIMVHDHPSGDSSPSQEDITITKRLIECGKLLGISCLDHIIIGFNQYHSLKELNLI